jgi:MFS family permease
MLGPVRDIAALGLHRNIPLQVIFGSSMLMIMGASLVYPVLPVVADALDIGEGRIGLVLTAFSVPAVFLAPLGGFLIDRRGRKQVLVASLLMYGIAGGGIVLVDSLPWLLVMRFMQGVAYAGIMPLVVVLIGDTFSREQETTAQGVKVMLDRGTLLFLPALAGGLAALAWQAPFAIYALAIPLGLAAARWLREPAIQRRTHAPLYIREVFAASFRLRSLAVFSMSSLRFFLETAFFIYVPLFALDRLGVEVAKGGLLFSAFAVGSIFTAGMVGTWARRFDRFSMVIAAFVAQGFSLAAAALAPSIWVLGASMLVFGLANGIISPAQKSLMTQSVEGPLRGGFVAADRTIQAIAKSVAPIFAGAVVVASSIGMLFQVLAAMSFAWAAATLALHLAGRFKAPTTVTAKGAEADA